MIQDKLKRSEIISQFGKNTQFTNSTEQQDLQLILAQSTTSIDQFQKQIRLLQSQLSSPSQPLQDINVQQSHFWLKRTNNEGQNQIVITAEYLQDAVFDNLKQQQLIELDTMERQAKEEIDRLVGILTQRDILIQKQQFQINRAYQKLDASSNTQWNIDQHFKQHQTLLTENNRLNNLIKQLTSELQMKQSNIKKLEQQNRNAGNSLKVTVSRTTGRDGNSINSLQRPGIIKQIKSIDIQTDKYDIAQLNHPLQLKQKIQEIDHLNKVIETLRLQFQSLKNDNLLFFQDVQRGRVRIDELEKIIQIERNHIEQLRRELQAENIKCKQLTDKINTSQLHESRKGISIVGQNNVNGVITTPHHSSRTHAHQPDLSSQVSRLKLDNSKLLNNFENLNRQVQPLRRKNNDLIRQLVQEKNKNTQSNILNRQLQTKLKNIETSNTDLVNLNNDLRNQIRNHQNNLLSSQRQNQQINQLKRELANLKLRQDQWINLRIKLQQQLTRNQLDVSTVNNENQKILNDNIKMSHEYEIQLQAMKDQLEDKNNIIYELERRQKQADKTIAIYKNEFNERNKGVIGFGTSNSLTDKTPQKIQVIQTPEDLIQSAKLLLNRGFKNENMDNVYNILQLLTQQLQATRQDLFQAKRIPTYSNNSNPSVFQLQTNNYIHTLLATISQHQAQQQKLYNQISKLRSQIDRMSLLINNQDNKGWDDVLSELEFERKLTQKLSDHIKLLKQQIFNLTTELQIKNDEIYSLSNKAYTGRDQLIREVDYHLGDIQRDYQILLNNSRQKNLSESSDNTQLVNQLQLYKIELEKAAIANQQLQEYLKDEQNIKQCTECQEYQQLVQDLEGRLENYQKLMMGEIRRIFTSCEKQINQKGRIDIHTRIQNLKQKTLHKHFENNFENPKKIDSPRSRKPAIKTLHRKHTMLDHLVQTQKLSIQAILVLMLKIINEIDNQKLYLENSPILPEHILILDFDKNHPQNAQVQIAQTRQANSIKSRLYLAPQRLRGCEPTRKSLVWNVGLIFHFIVNKKPYFNSQSDILDKYYPYKYENKLLSELKMILQGMLEKESSKRKLFSQIRNLTNNELARFKMIRGRV